MIKNLLLLSVVVVLFTSCDKTPITPAGCTYMPSTIKASASEIAYIQNYLTINGLTAVQDTSGYFYNISAAGSGTSPGICSSVLVQYTGWLFNGFKFDENLSGTIFKVGAVIEGWQKVLPTMKPGEIITIYLPPSMAYGANSTATIPANSYLKFQIKLVAVQ